MSKKTIADIMAGIDEDENNMGIQEGTESNVPNENSKEAVQTQEEKELGLFDEEYEEGFCEACGSADLEVRPSGLIICNSCNHMDRRNYNVEVD